MSENNHRGVTPGDSAVDHAVEAGKRLRDAARKVGGAYSDGYQQTILGIADFPGKNQPGDRWRTNAGAAVNADEVAQAGKQIGRAFIDAHERAALITIELHERLAAAANTDWVKSLAETQAALEREAANAYFSLARGLLA
jgi:hypothetical protein